MKLLTGLEVISAPYKLSNGQKTQDKAADIASIARAHSVQFINLAKSWLLPAMTKEKSVPLLSLLPAIPSSFVL